ncbi:hypothetical protein T484DRAFT_1918339 [Baffinella frigidus]|nr:hypothetical protein T484DRAFT_1918339 [Cryptophyta sp. CCMP2293]
MVRRHKFNKSLSVDRLLHLWVSGAGLFGEVTGEQVSFVSPTRQKARRSKKATPPRCQTQLI